MRQDFMRLLRAKLLEHHDNGLRFDLNKWWDEGVFTTPDMTETWCGSVVCALGLATTIPEFRAKGLRIDFLKGKGIVYLGSNPGFYAAAELFDICYNEACILFAATYYPVEQQFGDAGARFVAGRIGELMACETHDERVAFGQKYPENGQWAMECNPRSLVCIENRRLAEGFRSPILERLPT